MAMVVDMATEMTRPATILEPEWKRIEVLAQCLFESRAGREPPEVRINQLRDLQHQIEFLIGTLIRW